MSGNVPVLLELLAMAAVWLLAAGIAQRLGRPGGKGLGPRRPSGLGSLFVFIALPVLVILISRAAILGLGAIPAAHAWLAANRQHATAWEIFWSGVGILYLAEGILHLIYGARGRPFPVPDLLLNILRLVLILALAFLVLKAELGLDIGPLLASTALLTAVIGFALQGVLGNLLAGMSLHICRSVVPGDWIDLGTTEGQVIQTNWRETRVRTNNGHMMIVPNSQVSESVIHNLSRPDVRRRHQLSVGASYADAPDEVIAALLEAALEVPEVLRDPPPDAYVTAYLDFGINYVLRFWSDDYNRRLVVEGDVNRMIWYRFKRRGIEIPFPMSDKLLNDFMEVVQAQGRQPAPAADLARIADQLRSSDLGAKLVVDQQGRPLLDGEDFARLAPHVRRVLFTRGETLFRQGQPGDSCFVLVRGKLAGTVRNEGGEKAAEFSLGPGALVGEMSLLLGAPRSAQVVVAESSELLELDPQAFRILLGLREEVPEALARLAAERAQANRAALEAWAAQRPSGQGLELSQKGFLKRFLQILGRY